MGCWLAPALLLASACTAPVSSYESVAVQRWPIVYGEDGRIESYEVGDEALQRIAQQNTLAIVLDTSVSVSGESVEISAPSVGGSAQVCAGERFAEQPSPVVCTGLLVDNQTLLTADHCARGLGCDRMRFLRGYFYESAGMLHELHASDVYRCKSVVAQELSPTANAQRVDYAWIELDRPVPGPLAPIEFRPREEELLAGEPVSLVGFPSGVPLKVDLGGTVTDARAATLDYFISNLDAFHGNSGSPVFDASDRLVGVEGRGNADYALAGDGCAVVVQASDDPALAAEQATYAFQARAALCAARPSSAACCDAGTSCDAAVRQDADLMLRRSCAVSAVRPAPAELQLALFFMAVGFVIRGRGSLRRSGLA